MNTDGTGFHTCKECHETESLWNHSTIDHKEGEQLEDRRSFGASSCKLFYRLMRNGNLNSRNSKNRDCTVLHNEIVRDVTGSGVPRGVSNPAPPPRNSEGPPKLCQNSTRLWKLLKIAEFRTPTPQDVRKKAVKSLNYRRFAIVLH